MILLHWDGQIKIWYNFSYLLKTKIVFKKNISKRFSTQIWTEKCLLCWLQRSCTKSDPKLAIPRDYIGKSIQKDGVDWKALLSHSSNCTLLQHLHYHENLRWEGHSSILESTGETNLWERTQTTMTLRTICLAYFFRVLSKHLLRGISSPEIYSESLALTAHIRLVRRVPTEMICYRLLIVWQMGDSSILRNKYPTHRAAQPVWTVQMV